MIDRDMILERFDYIKNEKVPFMNNPEHETTWGELWEETYKYVKDKNIKIKYEDVSTKEGVFIFRNIYSYSYVMQNPSFYIQ